MSCFSVTPYNFRLKMLILDLRMAFFLNIQEMAIVNHIIINYQII